MLNAVEAEIIVNDCIRQAVGFSGPIEAHYKLSDVGIVDSDAREALNDEIVTNPTKGVRSRNHVLGPDDLTFTTDTKVFELHIEVRQKAVPFVVHVESLAAPKPKRPRKKRASAAAGKGSRK